MMVQTKNDTVNAAPMPPAIALLFGAFSNALIQAGNAILRFLTTPYCLQWASRAVWRGCRKQTINGCGSFR